MAGLNTPPPRSQLFFFFLFLNRVKSHLFILFIFRRSYEQAKLATMFFFGWINKADLGHNSVTTKLWDERLTQQSGNDMAIKHTVRHVIQGVI